MPIYSVPRALNRLVIQLTVINAQTLIGVRAASGSMRMLFQIDDASLCFLIITDILGNNEVFKGKAKIFLRYQRKSPVIAVET